MARHGVSQKSRHIQEVDHYVNSDFVYQFYLFQRKEKRSSQRNLVLYSERLTYVEGVGVFFSSVGEGCPKKSRVTFENLDVNPCLGVECLCATDVNIAQREWGLLNMGL